jgi:putative ABC transport system substrate-binding protein
MRRRDFIKGIAGSAAAWSVAARAQQGGPTRRVAVLIPYSEGDSEGKAVVTAFQRGLENLGWTEGRNIQFIIRWAGGDPDKARTFAKELVGMTPDVIVPSSNQITTILQQETRTIPIVFILVGDPVGSGYVASMAQPGFRRFGERDRRQMGGDVERDRASSQPRRIHAAPGNTRKRRLAARG